MGKTKKDTNARVAGRRKQTKESATEQMCMDNVPMDLNESDDSSVSDSKEESKTNDRQIRRFGDILAPLSRETN